MTRGEMSRCVRLSRDLIPGVTVCCQPVYVEVRRSYVHQLAGAGIFNIVGDAAIALV